MNNNKKESIQDFFSRIPLQPPTALTGGGETVRRKKPEEGKFVEKVLDEGEDLSPSTIRRNNAAQLYFYDYYFDLLSYLRQRKERTRQLGEELTKCSGKRTEELKQSFYQQETKALVKRRNKTKLSHFQLLTQVGQGGYGQVFLARKHDTGELCALKRMNKKMLLKLNEVQHILTERDILTTATSDWLVKLFYAFQDVDHVYLAMEFVPGGDLRTLLNTYGVIRIKHARFYMAEMMMATDALHQLGYVHRDLKPENFLVDAFGHLKLTDFGLSKGALDPKKLESIRIKLETMRLVRRSSFERRELYHTMRGKNISRAFSLVGSPEYMAPEILTNNGEGYDHRVDYWSLGCILYEFLASYPPFCGENDDEVYDNVMQWGQVLSRPQFESPLAQENFSDDAWDLVLRLVTDKEGRMQSLGEARKHSFFSELADSWLTFRTSQEPPFVPDLDSAEDTHYFDDFSNLDELEMYKAVQERYAQLNLEEQRDSIRVPRSAFTGFTFRHERAKKEKPSITAILDLNGQPSTIL